MEAVTGEDAAKSDGPTPHRPGPFRRFLFQGEPASKAERDAHLAAMANLEQFRARQYEHEHLYQCLSILDSKAAALLSFDSILVATSTIVLTLLKTTVSVGAVLIFAALVASGVSSTLNLAVISLKWTETEDFLDPDRYFEKLLALRGRRSTFYRCAWLAALLALFLIVVGLIVWRRA